MNRQGLWKRKHQIKINGGYRNKVYLDTQKNQIKKTYVGPRGWTRLLGDFYFHLYSPVSPPVIRMSQRFKRLYVGYIKRSRIVTLPNLLENGSLKKISFALKDMQDRYLMRLIKEQHRAAKTAKNKGAKQAKPAQEPATLQIDYREVLQKYLAKISDQNFVRELQKKKNQLDVLNKPEDFSLVHGDLALHNILLQRRILGEKVYFVDGEVDWLKTNASVGNKYIDPAFFIAHSILLESYHHRLKTGQSFSREEIEWVINSFLAKYAPKNSINQKKLVRAMAFCFIRKFMTCEGAEKIDKKEQEIRPVWYILKELSRYMTLQCLEHERLSTVLDGFFGKYEKVTQA